MLEKCTESGLIFLELVGDKDKHQELARKLNLLKGINAQFVTLSVDD